MNRTKTISDATFIVWKKNVPEILKIFGMSQEKFASKFGKSRQWLWGIMHSYSDKNRCRLGIGDFIASVFFLKAETYKDIKPIMGHKIDRAKTLIDQIWNAYLANDSSDE